MLTPSPALLTELNKVLDTYGYQFKHGVLNTRQKNSRYLFSDDLTNITIELKPNNR